MSEARSPFSANIPNFQIAQVACGIEISVKRLNRFAAWLHVDEKGCWIFDGPKTHNGYGTFGTGGRGGKNLRTHRLAYELWVGVIPDALMVLHTCDTRPCCNPEHLFAGTAKDNSTDMVAKGRAKSSGVVKWTEEMRETALEMYSQGAKLRDIEYVIGLSHETIRIFVNEWGEH